MNEETNVDRLIREALQAEGVQNMERLGDPGLLELTTEIFRSRMRWYGYVFVVMVLVLTILAVICGVRFLEANEVPAMLRWGAGLFLCVATVLAGKVWYWMQMERVTMCREIKRVELLVAHLASELLQERR